MEGSKGGRKKENMGIGSEGGREGEQMNGKGKRERGGKKEMDGRGGRTRGWAEK